VGGGEEDSDPPLDSVSNAFLDGVGGRGGNTDTSTKYKSQAQ
jgi:hypothetical protein